MKDQSSSERAPLATECYVGLNQTIKVKLHQISNGKQLKWNYTKHSRTNLCWTLLENQSKTNSGLISYGKKKIPFMRHFTYLLKRQRAGPAGPLASLSLFFLL